MTRFIHRARHLPVWALAAVLAVSTAKAVAEDEVACNPQGTQMEMNACASQDLKKADAELNTVYARVLEMHRDDAAKVKQLQAAQRLWIKLRDADLNAMFPLAAGENPRVKYGSMYSLQYDTARARMTDERARWLKAEFLENQED